MTNANLERRCNGRQSWDCTEKSISKGCLQKEKGKRTIRDERKPNASIKDERKCRTGAEESIALTVRGEEEIIRTRKERSHFEGRRPAAAAIWQRKDKRKEGKGL